VLQTCIGILAAAESVIGPRARRRNLARVLGFVGYAGAIWFFVHPNPQRAKKIQILGGEGSGAGGIRRLRLCRLRGGFIEPDRRFQDQHDLKALRADIAHHAGDLIGFSYGLVDGFAKLLNEIAYLAIQIQPPAPKWRRFSYHTLLSRRGQCRTARLLHFFCVDKVRLGRRLGIGTRLAAKALREQAQNLGSAGNSSSAAPATQRRPASAPPRAEAKPRSVTMRSVVPSGNLVRKAAQGGRGFGRAFWKPFSAAGRALWHEVTGLFFALFALFFGQSLWNLRDAWRFGPEHRHFVIDLVMTVLFLYFSISAFVRSRRPPQ
jgi:hypothetical protein